MKTTAATTTINSLLAGIIISFLCISVSNANDVIDYQWEENRERIDITSEEQKEPALILKNLQVYEYKYDEENEDLFLYNLVHKVIRVNNDDAIENFNKIYIPTDDIIEIINIKARSVNKNGEIIEVDQSNIKEIKNEEDESGFKIFAIEGVELESEIEYFYISKQYVSFFGRDYFQFMVPAKNSTFKLISPENLKFSVKGYNSFPSVTENISNGKRILEANIDYVPAFKQEAFSFYNSNRMRVEYKLSYNTIRGKTPLLTWSDAAKRIHSNIYTFDKKERRAVRKLVRKLKLRKLKSDEEKIAVIENYFKTNIILQEGFTDEMYDVRSIIENQYGNKTGLVRLYAAVFKRAEIDHELVMTSDRSNIKFDMEFESWNYLVNYLFYFPKYNSYLSPERFEFRYGMVPYYMTYNYGLFIKSVSLGDFDTGIGEVRFIPALDYTKNFDNLDIQIRFSENMDKTDINLTRELGGYSGAYIQPFYAYLQEDKRRTIAEELVKMSAEDAHFKQLEVKNSDLNISPIKFPFTINAQIESSSLIERAGTKYLFKFGKVIGPQSELYQEKIRESDIENDFNRSYQREIKFEIPKNYIVKNLDDVKMDVYFKKGGERVFNFTSEYTIKENIVTVKINEYYKEIMCSSENFEEFRKVINAAADFNKVTLVLERNNENK